MHMSHCIVNNICSHAHSCLTVPAFCPRLCAATGRLFPTRPCYHFADVVLLVIAQQSSCVQVLTLPAHAMRKHMHITLARHSQVNLITSNAIACHTAVVSCTARWTCMQNCNQQQLQIANSCKQLQQGLCLHLEAAIMMPRGHGFIGLVHK